MGETDKATIAHLRAALERQAQLANKFSKEPSYFALEGQGFVTLRNLALTALLAAPPETPNDK